MTEQLVWVLEITDPDDGTCTVHQAPDEAGARSLAEVLAVSGQDLLLRRGTHGPVVDIWTAPGPTRRTELEVVAPRHQPEPARNKLEAVSRLGRLNGGPPETLGPGSKERKSVLLNLAVRLGLEMSPSLTKPELGDRIAASLGTVWDSSCWSTGSTLTLEGLNRLLVAAEARLSQGASSAPAEAPEVEGAHLLEVLAASLPATFDGERCVEQMRQAEFSQWAQDEWAGFYFEFLGLPALISSLGGGPISYVNTRFDYSLTSVWDLKCHGGQSGKTPLNDTRAIEACLAERGLGFVVLTGDVKYDDGSFRDWFKGHRLLHGKRAAVRASPATYVRKSKPAFVPRRLQAFHIPGLEALAAARTRGELSVLNQGRQTSGKARPPKYCLDLVRAANTMLVAEIEL